MAIGSDTSTADRHAPSPQRRSGDPQLRRHAPTLNLRRTNCRRVGPERRGIRPHRAFHRPSPAHAWPRTCTPRSSAAAAARAARASRIAAADAAMLLAAVGHGDRRLAGAAHVRRTSLGRSPTPALTLVILEARGFYGFRLQDTPVDAVARIFAATSIAAMTLTFARALVSDDATLTAQTRAPVGVRARLPRRRPRRHHARPPACAAPRRDRLQHAHHRRRQRRAPDRETSARAARVRPAADRLPRQGPADRGRRGRGRVCPCSAPAGTSSRSCSATTSSRSS